MNALNLSKVLMGCGESLATEVAFFIKTS